MNTFYHLLGNNLNRISKTLLIFLMLCQIPDALFTYQGVLKFGPIIEGNAMVRYVMINHGYESIFLIKFAVFLLILYLYKVLSKKPSILYVLSITLVCAAYVYAIVIWSLFFYSINTGVPIT